jgi:acetyltransferase-like isoleucine patch superfamily enzyme
MAYTNVEIVRGLNVRIDETVKIIGSGKIILGDNVQIRAYSIIEIDGTLEIGARSVIGYHNFIQCSGICKIGVGSLIGPNTVMLASSHQITDVPLVDEKMLRSFLTIKDNVWVGANCTINHGITLDDNCIIGANSFVKANVGKNEIVGGVPAKLIRTR